MLYKIFKNIFPLEIIEKIENYLVISNKRKCLIQLVGLTMRIYDNYNFIDYYEKMRKDLFIDDNENENENENEYAFKRTSNNYNYFRVFRGGNNNFKIRYYLDYKNNRHWYIRKYEYWCYNNYNDYNDYNNYWN